MVLIRLSLCLICWSAFCQSALAQVVPYPQDHDAAYIPQSYTEDESYDNTKPTPLPPRAQPQPAPPTYQGYYEHSGNEPPPRSTAPKASLPYPEEYYYPTDYDATYIPTTYSQE